MAQRTDDEPVDDLGETITWVEANVDLSLQLTDDVTLLAFLDRLRKCEQDQTKVINAISTGEQIDASLAEKSLSEAIGWLKHNVAPRMSLVGPYAMADLIGWLEDAATGHSGDLMEIDGNPFELFPSGDPE